MPPFNFFTRCYDDRCDSIQSFFEKPIVDYLKIVFSALLHKIFMSKTFFLTVLCIFSSKCVNLNFYN